MARTVKVTAKKAAKERAREAGDKKLPSMKRVREENKKRAQRIRGRKEKHLKIERKERKRKVQRGMQALKEIQK